MNIYALANSTDSSFFEDLWDFIYGTYLSVDGNYHNLGIDASMVTPVRIAALAIFLGTLLACVYMVYNKQVLGGAVRKMLSEEQNCRSRENAKTLSELGLEKNIFIRGAVQRSTSLRRVVRCVGEEDFYREQNEKREEYEKKRAESKEKMPRFRDIEYRVDAKADRFYIPEELCDMASHKFDSKGFSWVSAVVGIIVLCICFFIVLLVLPKVLTMLNDFLGGFNIQL